MKTLRLALSQINTLVGDLKGNKGKILNFIKQATKYKVDVIVFPELAISGYPPEDLILKPQFRTDCKKVLNEIIKENKFSGILVLGYVEEYRGEIYNSAAIVNRNRLVVSYRKINLPNYGVFDEKRYFTPGKSPLIIKVNRIGIGITICEDIWVENKHFLLRNLSPAELLINISASPYHRGKIKQRVKLLEGLSKKYNFDIVYVNLVGGQDELIFDGASIVVRDNKVRMIARQFQEDILYYDFKFNDDMELNIASEIETVDIRLQRGKSRPPIEKRRLQIMDNLEEIYSALVLGTRDYVRKNGFKKVIIGLSGGIDSSLVATIAVDALGRENVVAVSMPSMFSSAGSLDDAQKLASNLGIQLVKIPITEVYKNYLEVLKTSFDNLPFDKTEENIQARIRGNILMALSNKFGYLVLTTGNKSELSTGYCTLYGDMAGGFAVIKDVPKTIVYRLARWRNREENKALIPREIFTKPPSAELKPGQKDQDTLPEYKILDKIISLYIEEDKSLYEIVNLGFNKKLVEKVVEMIDKSEYKRRQAPPGIKITPKAFGKDRRMPITCGYKI